MKATFKILPRTDSQKKDGSYSIMLRLTLNGKQRKYYSLGISMPNPKKYWDPVNFQILKYPGVNPVQLRENNQLLQKHIIKAKKIIWDYDISDNQLTCDEFKTRFLAKGDIKTSFYDFAQNEIDSNKKLSKETIRSYNSYLSKLKAFRPTINFSEITLEFIKSYHGYMIKKRGNGVNTCHKSLSFIRTMLYHAKTAGIVKENIFYRNYPLTKTPGKRPYLTENELYRLEQLLINVPLKNYQANVLKYFLFCCYCGLRYTDIKNLRYRELIKEVHTNKEKTIIRINMHKTGDPVEIPLTERSLNLIGNGIKNEKVFRVNSNQTTNRYLKESVELCQIDKTISFHCSRHTFATYSLSRGMDVVTLKDILGHKDIKTTLLYAKLVPNYKIKAMEMVWDHER